MIGSGPMAIAELLPYVLLMFGVVFLVANIRAGG
jgi:hypothetical protein